MACNGCGGGCKNDCNSECWNTKHENNPNHGPGNTDETTGGCKLSSCMDDCNVCSNRCGNSCQDGCKGDCGSGCSGGCYSCTGTCSSCTGTCVSGCDGGCKTKCALACAISCGNTCTLGCTGQCNYGCQSEEVDSLYAQLNLQRLAKNVDINLMKKIIFRLFEIRDKSDTLNKNSSYQTEYPKTEKDIYGLIPDTIEKDETYTLSLAFNETFQNIINNLNNANAGRVDLDPELLRPQTDDATGITYNLINYDTAIYWINCLKKIYDTIAPIKGGYKETITPK